VNALLDIGRGYNLKLEVAMLPRVAFLTASLCCVLVSPTVARAQDLASTIVGVWKAISVESKEVVSGKINRPFGDKPEGTWVFTRGGRTLFMVFHGDRKSPAAANATDAERVALFNSMTAYIGTYRVDGDKVIVTVDNSAIQSWNGTQRSTTITVSGTQFTSRAAPFKAATTGLVGDGDTVPFGLATNVGVFRRSVSDHCHRSSIIDPLASTPCSRRPMSADQSRADMPLRRSTP
jgi:hypothetical protein